MSGHQHRTLEDTVYFWFGSNDTSGSGNDGASAGVEVRLAGAGAGDAAMGGSHTVALLSHGDFPNGCYEIAVIATAANSFAATATYAVFCTLTVDSQNPTGFVGSFTLDPIISNVKEVSDDSAAADNLELALENGTAGYVASDVKYISGDSDAADNLELGYDGTGLSGDKFPVRQDQLAALEGGLGIITIATTAVITEGTETSGVGTYDNTNAHDGTRHVITDSGSGTGIELYYLFNTGSSSKIPTVVHIHGWFQDGSGPFTNTCAIRAWNFNTGEFVTIETLTHNTADEAHEIPLTVVNVSDGTVGTEGDVRIGFKITTQEASSTLNIDHLTITYGSFLTAANVVDEWETQSQADPTGFHVNLKEVADTNQTALDINDILDDTNEIQGKLPTNKFMGSSDGADDDGTLNTINTNSARLTAERAAVLTDWINDGRLDAILDSILAMLDDARTEPGQVAPPVNPDLATKIDYLYKFLRNTIDNDGSTIQVYNDGGGTVDHKSTVGEAGGTVTRGEFGSGP